MCSTPQSLTLRWIPSQSDHVLHLGQSVAQPHHPSFYLPSCVLQYIRCHRPAPLTMEAALQEVKEELKS